MFDSYLGFIIRQSHGGFKVYDWNLAPSSWLVGTFPTLSAAKEWIELELLKEA